MEGKVPATERRAVFVGAEAYEEAGGYIHRDLVPENGAGYFEDVVLLDTLVVEGLREIAAEVQAEGWKWAEAHINFPHDHGMRRYYPQSVSLSDEDEARLVEASEKRDQLTEGYSSHDEMPEDLAAKVAALNDEIDAISAKRTAFDPELIERGGVLPRVIWSYDHQVPDVGLSRPGAHARARGLCRPEGQVALADRRGRHRILPFTRRRRAARGSLR